MPDNLKSAVLKRAVGQAPVFNPRYMDFADHYGFSPVACNVGKGNEKGRVEAGVGYVKKNLLAGLDIADFKIMKPIADHWLDTVANVRVHKETGKKPVELFEEERLASGKKSPDFARIDGRPRPRCETVSRQAHHEGNPGKSAARP